MDKRKNQTKETTVVNIKTTNDYDVYIGRGSIWGNPFSHKKGTLAKCIVASRKEAVEKYREWILEQPNLLKQLDKLKGKKLGCHCKPRSCHGDVLVELIENQKFKSIF